MGTARRSATPLGLRTPPRTPQHTPWMCTPGKSPGVPASPFVLFESGGCTFGFTVRLAEGVELGLEIHQRANDKALHVNSVKAGGAIEAWNKQCVSGPAAGKAVLPGDKIVAMNAATDPDSMLIEVRTKKMIRLTIVRGDPDDNVAGPMTWAGQNVSKLDRGRPSPLVSSAGAFAPRMNTFQQF